MNKSNPLKKHIPVLACLLSLAMEGHATEFHVATDGKDTNPGAQAAPLRSIQCGAEKVQPGDTDTTITVDPDSPGRTFDGIGAISGGGATSRLLIDYPEPQRREILDYLFKPGFGAALQINKVEIGGGISSVGSEPSHMRTENDENYHRGYEWWLMGESKKRNPAVKLFGLAWGMPSWINPAFAKEQFIYKNSKIHPWPFTKEARSRAFTSNYITYLLNWVRHAKSDHNLDIDYLSGWNEKGYDMEWYKQFRTALNEAGFPNIKVICDDTSQWTVAPGLKKDPSFASSFEIVGSHYAKTVPETKEKKERWQVCYDSGKPLWATEAGCQPYHAGAPNLAKYYNQGYIGSRMTGFINWPTLWSVLPGVEVFPNCGLMLANEPWSGHYEVGLSIWATAHTTQFAQPGWRYLDKGCGYLGGNATNGSVVTLCSPDRKNFSVIAETVDAKQPFPLSFEVREGLPSFPLHVWKTKLNSKADADWFVQQPDVKPADSRFSVTLDPGCLYTFSTISTAHKGTTPAPPASMPAPLPYREDFQSYELGATPKYISDQHGTFEIAKAGGGRDGKCLRQVIDTKPICWNCDADPATLMGHPEWKDYTVSVDTLLEQPGYVEIVGRMMGAKTWNLITGYHLRLDDRGHWSLSVVYDFKTKKGLGAGDVPVAEGATGMEKELASGDLPDEAGINKWNKLSLGFLGSKITASVNGHVLVTLEDKTYDHGLIALVTSRWNTSEFMNLKVVQDEMAKNSL